MNTESVDEQLATADEIAWTLHEERTDPNEVASCVTFLRDPDQALHFFDYLDAIIAEGRSVVRSGRTLGYYREIRHACRRYLEPYRENPEAMAWILGWTARLMRYHKAGGPFLNWQRLRAQSDASDAGELQMGDTYTGRVKFFIPQKYGFIVPDQGDNDVYVNHAQVRGGQILNEGDRVRFKLAPGSQGPQATDVQPE